MPVCAPRGRYVEVADLDPDVRPVWPTVGELAEAETRLLMALPPVPFPATIEVVRSVDVRATVAFRGNRYSVMPGMTGVEVTLRHRLGTGTLEIFSPAGRQLVSHVLAPPGCGAIVRTPDHKAALEVVVLGQFTSARPCDRKANKPPGTEALAARARLMGGEGAEPTVDLEAMADIVRLAFPGTTDVTDAESA